MTGLFTDKALAIALVDPTDFRVIRSDMKLALDEYGRGRRPTLGGFLTALLSGDLVTASFRADPYNKLTFVALIYYVQNRLPAECHGSSAKVDAWLEKARDRAARIASEIPATTNGGR